MVFTEKTIKSKKIYEGKVLTLRVDTIQTMDGKEATREIIEHRGAVAIAAVKDNKMIMVKQYRKAPDEVLLEVPAGKIEKDEPPLETAKRELQEETGYLASKISHVSTFYTSPGFSNEIIYLYLAEELNEGEASPDEDEFLKIEEYDFDTLNQMIRSGEINDGKTITAILLAEKAMKNR